MNLREAGSWLLVSVAVTCAVIVTYTTVVGASRSGPEQARSAPTQVRNWAKYAVGGHEMGASDAPVTIVEFGDFECPVCGSFARGALHYIRETYPTQVRVVFRQWPLDYHHLAYPAARAAECAGDQGRFEAMHDLIYSKQDSLGIKSFTSFARDAGVGDIGMFERCVGRSGSVASIEKGRKDAVELGGTGTPTLLINGLQLVGAPDSALLTKLVKEALSKAEAAR